MGVFILLAETNYELMNTLQPKVKFSIAYARSRRP
jgi:adenosine/AMP kinase